MSTWSLFVFVDRNAFAKMDLDGNGTIDADELGLVLKSFGEAVPPGRLKALIREVQNAILVCSRNKVLKAYFAPEISSSEILDTASSLLPSTN